jgi:hypothetical protein
MTMRLMKLMVRTSALAVVASLWCNQAYGAYTYYLTGYAGGAHDLTLDGVNGSHIAARLNMQESTSGSGVAGFANFNTVCLSLNGTLYWGNYQYTQEAFSGEMGLNPEWGTGNGPGNTGVNATSAYRAVCNAALLYATYKDLGTTDWGALQIAVWAALYNTDNSGALTGNRFSMAYNGIDATEALAQTYLNNTLATPAGDYVGYMLKPVNGSMQELILTPTPVPEPTTVIAGVLLLLPFGASTLRFIRKNRTA